MDTAKHNSRKYLINRFFNSLNLFWAISPSQPKSATNNASRGAKIVINWVNVTVLSVLIYAIGQILWLINETPWHDEMFTLILAKLPFNDMFLAIVGDVHPPLYYFIASLAAGIPATTRLISLACVAVAFVFLWEIMRELNLSTTHQLIVFSLFCTSPFIITYATEARMYGLLLLIILMAFYSAFNKFNGWLAILITLGLYTHNLMALYIIPLMAVYVYSLTLNIDIYSRKRIAYKLWEVLAVSFLLYLPWLPYALGQLAGVKNSFWVLPLRPGRVIFFFKTFFINQQNIIDNTGVIVIVCLLLLIALSTKRARQWPLMVMAFGPLVIGSAISLLIAPILISRVLIGSVPFVFIIVGYGLLELKAKWGNLAWWVTLPAFFVVLFNSGFIARPPSNINYLPIGINDACLHVNTGTIIANYNLPCTHYLHPLALENSKAQGLSDQTILPTFNVATIDTIPNKTVWLVWGKLPFTPPSEGEAVNQILTTTPPTRTYKLAESEISKFTVWQLEK